MKRFFYIQLYKSIKIKKMKKLIILFATILFVGCQQPTDSIASVKMDVDKTQAIK